MSREYTAIHELDKKLTELGIPHSTHRMHEGWQIVVPENCGMINWEISAVQHQFSYGNAKDLIEIWDGHKDPIGFLTVDETLKYFVEWHKKQEKKRHGKEKENH